MKMSSALITWPINTKKGFPRNFNIIIIRENFLNDLNMGFPRNVNIVIIRENFLKQSLIFDVIIHVFLLKNY